MKKEIIIGVCVSLILVCSCNKARTVGARDDFDKLKSKCIITTHYTPILHEGSWICGSEYKGTGYISDTVYFDKYNNTLLRILNGGHVSNKYIYFSPEKHLLSKIYSEQNENIDSAIFIRGKDNKVLEMRVSGSIFQGPSESIVYRYDNGGELSEIQKERKKTIIKYLSSETHFKIKSYKVIDESSKFSANGEMGLVEEGTEIFNSLDQLIHKVKDVYKYGMLGYSEETIITDDTINKIVIEETKGKKNSSFFTIPKGLSRQETEEYIKENYYNNIEYSPIHFIKESRYNKEGYLISYIYKSLDDSGQLKIKPSFCEKYKYEYDERKHWTKKYSYSMFQNSSMLNSEKLKENNEPYMITVREIIQY